MPDFDEKIQKVVPLSKGYLDMVARNSNYEFTDGNHLYKASGKIVSKKVAKWIEKKQ